MISYIIIGILAFTCIFLSIQKKKINHETDKQNQSIEYENDKLRNEYKELVQNLSELRSNIDSTKDKYEAYTIQLKDLEKDIAIAGATLNENSRKTNDIKIEYDKTKIMVDNLLSQEKQTRDRIEELGRAAESAYDQQKELAGKAFENYCDVLSKAYKEKDEEYNILSENLENAYSNIQNKLMEEATQLQNKIADIQKELDTIQQNRAAAMEAIQREQFVKDNLSSYCLQLSDIDKADVQRLEDVCIALSPKAQRTLHMLIWQTYFQKQLKTLEANIMGANSVTGIYKITNINTGQAYIGQAVGVQDRWSQHCKCMLGIDTPTGNKLYQAAAANHIWDFSWELLEKCEPKQLNDREAYYIEMYNAYEFGYNSTHGNKH